MSHRPETIVDVSDVDCTGTQALVTGSTSGIGREAALALGRLGADVVVHGRDEAAGAEVVTDLEAVGADATFVAADFADVEAVRDLAATVRAETDGLDVLVNNAGGYFRNTGRTDAGVEYTFHVNHLSPYLLTADLLDHLRDGARVVTTASGAHQGASLNLDEVRGTDRYDGFKAYGHSKLANVLFAAELARRLEAAGRDVTSNSIHPGAIPGSGFGRFLPGPLTRVLQALDAVPGVTSVEEGAAEILHVAVSPDTADVTGRYFTGQEPTTPSRAARDDAAARRLWQESARLLDVEEPLAEVGGDGHADATGDADDGADADAPGADAGADPEGTAAGDT
jgi:NAD(P)-dependent dehydrogenase (short-subunit alcohol dehydrogenase family)